MWGALANANASWYEHFLGLRGDQTQKTSSPFTFQLGKLIQKFWESTKKLNLNSIL